MKRLYFCLATAILMSPVAQAQNTASLSGIVQDSSGALIAGASVKLTSIGQNIARSAETNQAGIYQFSFLAAGGYNLEVSAAGFKTLTRTDVTLAVAQDAQLNVSLEVGNVSENVTVSAAAEALNTETTELGAVVDNTRVVEMPLNGRTFYSLATLTPGVSVPPTTGGNSFRGGLNVSGQSEVNNNFMLNGFFNNDTTVIVPGFRASVDSIQEFNILTGVYPAQYGYGSGGQIIVTQKSGTNQLHGTAFEYLRNSAMDARNFFQTLSKNPSFKRNQFGFTIGGPIIKNKTFFFYSYEGLRSSNAYLQPVTIPTDAMRVGDFSATGRTIRNPAGGNFANGIIPQSQFSAMGVEFMSYFPSPQRPTAVGALPLNNYTFTGTRTEHFNEHSLKLDHQFSAKDSLYVTANYYFDQSLEPGPATSTCGATSLPGFACDFLKKDQLYGISETHVLSPSMVNEARIGFTFNEQPAFAKRTAQNFWSKYGISPWITRLTDIPSQGIPSVTITGFQGFAVQSFNRWDPHWHWSDTFSWTHGRHTIKTGVDIIHISTNNSNIGNQLGTLNFTNTSAGPTTGLGLADMLLGLPATTTNQPYTNKLYLRSSNIGAYVQDDFKIRPGLTLNIGLRWEMNTPVIDYAHHMHTFDTVKGIKIIEGTTPYLDFVPGGFGAQVINNDWHDFAPRLGVSWQPFSDGKTVVRAGAGTFYNVLPGYRFGGITGAYPITNTFTSSLAQPITLADPFPTTNAVASNNTSGADPNFKNQRTYEWSLGFQRELSKDTVLEMTYLGTHTSHMTLQPNINQPSPGPGTPAQVNARRRYPNFGTINWYEYGGNANYHSAIASIRKRAGGGLSFLGSYTLGKATDDAGTSVSCNCGTAPSNNFDRRTGRGPSAFDIRHRVIFSPVYELPFGKGKQFVTNGVAAQIIGGWQISSLFSWQTGRALTPTLSGNYSNAGGTTDRPDAIHNPNSDAPHEVEEWFDTGAFVSRPASGAAGATYSFGNAGRGIIRGPGVVQTDFSIVRNFAVRELMKIQFRAEFFNIANHANFADPNVSMGTTEFGVISAARDPRQTQLALRIVF